MAHRRARSAWCRRIWSATTQALGDREHRIMTARCRTRRVWLFIAIYFCIIAANSTLTFYGPTLVKEVGFASPATVGWIMARAYLCGAAGMILNGRQFGPSRRSRGIIAALAALIGAGRDGGRSASSIPNVAVSGPDRADAGHRRHDERHPGVLADAEPLPRRRRRRRAASR